MSNGLEWRSLSTLTHGWSAARKTRALRPDVALVMNVANGFWLPMLERVDIPTVVNVDGIEWERDKWSRLGKFVFRRAAIATARHASRIVVDSKEIGRRWETDFGRTGDFIPYGGETPASLPVEAGLNSGSYALVVARFVPENTINEFLIAAEAIAKKFDVVIVGSEGYGGALDASARALADANPRVRWLGHLSDDRRLHALWQHAGVYFHGHSVGGTNPALVQAMACGAPTVARDTVYNREVLDDAGLFTAPEPGAIADASLKVLADPKLRAALSIAAQQRAAMEYSWTDVCRRYESALSRAAEEGA